jgi:hypothetical protein
MYFPRFIPVPAVLEKNVAAYRQEVSELRVKQHAQLAMITVYEYQV